MSHKIPHAMGERDSLYMLSGTMEVDDAFFGGAHEEVNVGVERIKPP